jgi:hypothetical protein
MQREIESFQCMSMERDDSGVRGWTERLKELAAAKQGRKNARGELGAQSTRLVIRKNFVRV